MSLQPGNADKWIKEGINHYNAKRYKECLDACEQAIQLDPDCARAYHGKGLALAQQIRYKEALIAYRKASHLAAENAKIHVEMAELYYTTGEYETSGSTYRRAIQLDSQFEVVYLEKAKMLLDLAIKDPNSPMFDFVISGFRNVLLFNPGDAIAFAEIERIQKERELALVQYGIDLMARAEQYFYKGDFGLSGSIYNRAIQLDSQFEAVYIEKAKMLLDEAFKWNTPGKTDLAIYAFHQVLLFSPGDATALAEIGKIQKEVESLRSRPKRYTGALSYTEGVNSASIILCSHQSDEEVRIFFVEKENDKDTPTYIINSLKYFSKMADGWRISFPFPSPETNFKVEVLRNNVVIAYGYYYWINKDLEPSAENNIYLSIAKESAQATSNSNSHFNVVENNSDFRFSSIYIPDRRRGRSRRARRGS